MHASHAPSFCKKIFQNEKKEDKIFQKMGTSKLMDEYTSKEIGRFMGVIAL